MVLENLTAILVFIDAVLLAFEVFYVTKLIVLPIANICQLVGSGQQSKAKHRNPFYPFLILNKRGI